MPSRRLRSGPLIILGLSLLLWSLILAPLAL